MGKIKRLEIDFYSGIALGVKVGNDFFKFEISMILPFFAITIGIGERYE